MIVGVKFCGNCNPRIDTEKLLQSLKKQATNIQFVFQDFTSAHILLVLSGCPVNCVTMPLFSGPVITVAGETLDGFYFSEEQLPNATLEKIEKLREEFLDE